MPCAVPYVDMLQAHADPGWLRGAVVTGDPMHLDCIQSFLLLLMPCLPRLSSLSLYPSLSLSPSSLPLSHSRGAIEIAFAWSPSGTMMKAHSNTAA